MQHYVYKITNKTTGEYYYGKRSCEGSWRDDTYMGSGVLLKRKMEAHPDHDWRKEVLLLLDTEEEAYTYEAISIGDRWRDDPLCLNLCEGGAGAGSDTMRSIQLEKWADPEYKEMMSAVRRKTWADQDRRERLSELKKTQCSDPEYKATKRRQINKQWQDPEFQQRVSEARAEQWADPEYRKLRTAQTKAQYADATVRVKRGDDIREVYKSELEQAIDDGWMLTGKIFMQHDTHKAYVSLMSAPTIKQLMQTGWEIGMCAAYRKVKVSEAKALT